MSYLRVSNASMCEPTRNAMAAILCMYKIGQRMQIFLRNLHIASHNDHVMQHCPGRTKIKIKKGVKILISFPIRDPYTIQPYHFQAI